MPTFKEALEKINRQQAAREKREAERPHRDFIKAALKVGFTVAQAEFMWEFLSQADHSHWSGRVG